MKIYIFTDYGNMTVLNQLKNLVTNKGHHYEVVKSVAHLNIDNDIILATNVACQYPIFKRYYSYNVYSMLDNKLSFYDFLHKHIDWFLESNIFLIPSYTKSYSGPNITKNFMLKAFNGFSGKFNQVKHGSVYDLIKQYSNTHQIQEVMNVKHIYGVSICCKFGKILSSYNYLTEGPITTTSFHAKRGCEIKFAGVKRFLKKMVDYLQLHGIIEVEFLIDHSNKIHVMECNPRISGSVRVPMYINSIIDTYIKTFHSKQITEIN